MNSTRKFSYHIKKLSVVVVVVIGLFLGPGLTTGRVPTVQAHANFERSEPAANERLTGGQPPLKVRVWFTEQVEAGYSELNVFDKNGSRVDVGDSHLLPGEPRALEVSIKPGLPDGFYTVTYKNVSAEDGHVIKGSFGFVVGEGQLPAGALTSPLDEVKQASDSGSENSNIFSIGLRWLNYLGGA